MSFNRLAFHPYIPAGALIAAALWLRLTDLHRLPVFIDEATHIHWAEGFAAGTNDYPFLMDGRVLWIVVLAQFAPLGPQPLWIARAAAAVGAPLAVAAAIAIGRRLGGWRAGWLAGAIMAVMPFAVFHDRQALSDPLTTAFGSAALAIALRPARRPAFVAAALALALAAALLTKFTSAPYLTVLLLAPLLLARDARDRRRRVLAALAAALLAAAVIGLGLLALRDRLGRAESIFANQSISFVTCPPALCQADLAEQWRRLPGALAGLWELSGPYFGWPLIVVAASAPAIAAWSPGLRFRRRVYFVGLGTLSMLIAVLLAAAQPLPPRYYSFLPAPLAALAAAAFVYSLRFTRYVWLAAAGLLILSAASAAAIIRSPESFAMPSIDRYQYFTGPYAGAGFRQAVAAVEAEATIGTLPALILARDWLPLSVGAHLNGTRAEVRSPLEMPWAEAEAEARSGRAVFVIEEVPRAQVAEAITPPVVALVPRNPETGLRARRLAGVGPEALRALFEVLFPRPEGAILQYDQLLSDTAEDVLLAAYPPHQTAVLLERLAQHPNPHVTVLETGGLRPWDPAGAQSQVAAVDFAGRPLRVIFLDERRLDPEGAMEAWLAGRLFRLGERWLGPLRIVEYAGDGEVRQRLVVEARFGEGLVLERVELLDAAARAGEAVRLRLIWRVDAATDMVFKVFVHLTAGEGILAQHDGQPAGEMRPTNSWRRGEVIVDQFAIRLPADAAPDAYQLRIGLYDAATQQRLPVALADGSAAEFYLGGAIDVR